jgi:2-polyprenyl-3-methyl-5-hydroxy-6-metoxy-1,4-benzoquinol methylase
VSSASDWKRLDALHHDHEADEYDRLIGREYAPYQSSHTAEPWANMLAALGARVVLDVGAGTGRTAIPMAAAGLDVVALDTSRGMLRRLVDAVVCQGVLHHLPDVERAIAEADRVLAPGGWLCLAEPDADRSLIDRSARALIEALRPIVGYVGGRRSPAAAHERSLEPEALIAPLRSRGYDVDTCYLVHPPYIYRYLPPGVSAAIASLLNLGDRTSRRPADIVVAVARKPTCEGFPAPIRNQDAIAT